MSSRRLSTHDCGIDPDGRVIVASSIRTVPDVSVGSTPTTSATVSTPAGTVHVPPTDSHDPPVGRIDPIACVATSDDPEKPISFTFTGCAPDAITGDTADTCTDTVST